LAADSGMVLYEVAFDKEGGDFSNPLIKIVADNNGSFSYATISHEDIDNIAKIAGLGRGETGKLIWTVFSSKGINEKIADEYKILEVTRLNGFEELPSSIYITGSATEGGTDLADALKMKETESGKFEIFTKLTSTGTFSFTDVISGSQRLFYIENGILKEGASTSTIGTEGVYRINLNFNTGAVSFKQVVSLGLYYSDWDDIMADLTYQGKGVWKAENAAINFESEDWGDEVRYKFRMGLLNSNGDAEYQFWGSANADNGQATGSTPASYYYLYEVDDSEWDYTYKFASEMNNSYCNILFDLQSTGTYTHSITKVSDQ